MIRWILFLPLSSPVLILGLSFMTNGVSWTPWGWPNADPISWIGWTLACGLFVTAALCWLSCACAFFDSDVKDLPISLPMAAYVIGLTLYAPSVIAATFSHGKSPSFDFQAVSFVQGLLQREPPAAEVEAAGIPAVPPSTLVPGPGDPWSKGDALGARPPLETASESDLARPESASSEAESTLKRMRSNLDDQLLPAIARLSSDRDQIKMELTEMGVTNSAQLRGNFRAQQLATELAETVGYLRVMEVKREAYERSIVELESLIRRVDRRTVAQGAGLSESELAEIAHTLRTIDAQLTEQPETPMELSPAVIDEVIDSELNRK